MAHSALTWLPEQIVDAGGPLVILTAVFAPAAVTYLAVVLLMSSIGAPEKRVPRQKARTSDIAGFAATAMTAAALTATFLNARGDGSLADSIGDVYLMLGAAEALLLTPVALYVAIRTFRLARRETPTTRTGVMGVTWAAASTFCCLLVGVLIITGLLYLVLPY